MVGGRGGYYIGALLTHTQWGGKVKQERKIRGTVQTHDIKMASVLKQ